MNRKTIMFFMLAASLLFSGTETAYAAKAVTPITVEVHVNKKDKAEIRFYAVDEDGAALSDVKVYLFSNQRTGYDYYGSTNTKGIFLLKEISEGTYTYRMEKKGYYAAEGTVTVEKSGKTYQVNATINKIAQHHPSHHSDHGGSGPHPVSSGGVDGSWHLDMNGGWHFGAYNLGELHGDWYRIRWNGKDSYFLFDDKGVVMSGWNIWRNHLYYLHPLHDGNFGVMESGWHMLDNKWYYFEEQSSLFHPEGSLLINDRTPDGYMVDSHGVWIPGV